MEPSKELIDALYWERVERARRMPPDERVLVSLRLFESASRITAAGIRAQFPDADENRVQEILRERLALGRRLGGPPMRPEEATAAVIDALDSLQIPYMLVGSLSCNYYAIPRSTQDADFVVQLDAGTISSLATRLGPAFQLDRQMLFETVTLTNRYVLRVAESEFVVELFLLSDDEHDRERFARRRRERILDRDVPIPTAEERDCYETPLVTCRPARRRPGRRPKRHCRPGRPDRLGLRDALVRPPWDAGSRWIACGKSRANGKAGPDAELTERIAAGEHEMEVQQWPQRFPLRPPRNCSARPSWGDVNWFAEISS